MGGRDEDEMRWEHTAAGLREQYSLLLEMLATHDPALHPAPQLDDLDEQCKGWGLPSPYRPHTRAYAQAELARLATLPPAAPADRDARLLDALAADRRVPPV